MCTLDVTSLPFYISNMTGGETSLMMCQAKISLVLMVFSVGIKWSLTCGVVTGWSLTTPENPISAWHAARNLLYASAISTDSWRNSCFLSEIHTRRHEEPSYWNFKTIPYAGGMYFNIQVQYLVFVILPVVFPQCLTWQMEMSSTMSLILENQAELMKEVLSLRKEIQQLRQFLWPVEEP